MKPLFDNFKKILTFILCYWFAMTITPEIFKSSNTFEVLFVASFGFAIIMLVIPFLLSFFKLPSKNPIAFFVTGFIFTVLFTYSLKPGIIGFIYFPESVNLEIMNFTLAKLGESGIIVFVSVVSVLLVTIINIKLKS